jgi:hypothetical protein
MRWRGPRKVREEKPRSIALWLGISVLIMWLLGWALWFQLASNANL